MLFQNRPPSAIRLCLKRHTESAVRECVHAQRVAEELRKALTGDLIFGVSMYVAEMSIILSHKLIFYKLN